MGELQKVFELKEEFKHSNKNQIIQLIKSTVHKKAFYILQEVYEILKLIFERNGFKIP
jgi:hypothetical protein